MGFFDMPPPPPEPPSPPPPFWTKPEGVLPGSVGVELILARSADAVVAVEELRGYPTGFEFTIRTVLRVEDRDGRMFPHEMHFRRSHGGEVPEHFLRLGVRFADGRAVTNLGGGFPDPATGPDKPVLLSDGGGGGGRHYAMRYWVWPLPPPGPLVFVCAWPARDIGETSQEIDAGAVRAAAARSVALWPDDPAAG